MVIIFYLHVVMTNAKLLCVIHSIFMVPWDIASFVVHLYVTLIHLITTASHVDALCSTRLLLSVILHVPVAPTSFLICYRTMIGDNNELNQLHQEVEALHTIMRSIPLMTSVLSIKPMNCQNQSCGRITSPWHWTWGHQSLLPWVWNRRFAHCQPPCIVIILTTIMSLVLMVLVLIDHMLSNNFHPDVAPWHRMDCIVVFSIFSTISSNLLEFVMTSSNPNH